MEMKLGLFDILSTSTLQISSYLDLSETNKAEVAGSIAKYLSIAKLFSERMWKIFPLGLCEQIDEVLTNIDSNLVFLSLFRLIVSNWIGKTLNESLLSATETSESTFTMLCYNFSHQKMGFFGNFLMKKPSDTP